MTNEWSRVYAPADLVAVMRGTFPHYHVRSCLIAMAAIFEGVLTDFWEILESRNIPQAKGRNSDYRPRLDWAFDRLTKTTYGSQGMLARLDQNRRDVDHVRRFRNCYLHNNGLYNSKYETTSLPIRGRSDLHEDYVKWKADQTKPCPVVPDDRDFDKYYKAHVELLHQLHDVVQREDCGYTGTGYSYQEQGKIIDWSRIMLGI